MREEYRATKLVLRRIEEMTGWTEADLDKMSVAPPRPSTLFCASTTSPS